MPCVNYVVIIIKPGFIKLSAISPNRFYGNNPGEVPAFCAGSPQQNGRGWSYKAQRVVAEVTR